MNAGRTRTTVTASTFSVGGELGLPGGIHQAAWLFVPPRGTEPVAVLVQNRAILARRFGVDPDATFFTVPRQQVRQLFFGPDVPDDVVAADCAAACAVPMAAAADIGTPGFVRAAAAGLTVPLLLGFGGVDTSADPLLEPSYYRAATDVTLRVFPTAHHCHNSATCRVDVYDAVADRVVARFGGVR
ncbi:MAG: hypothetical protein ABS81_00675 [Pseudonocardia sp. SCN 72-86]|nr:MAG: hypothetical protein ABS81_00675 [Pseudonocardia sp. SCN 72-86]